MIFNFSRICSFLMPYNSFNTGLGDSDTIKHSVQSIQRDMVWLRWVSLIFSCIICLYWVTFEMDPFQDSLLVNAIFCKVLWPFDGKSVQCICLFNPWDFHTILDDFPCHLSEKAIPKYDTRKNFKIWHFFYNPCSPYRSTETWFCFPLAMPAGIENSNIFNDIYEAPKIKHLKQ